MNKRLKSLCFSGHKSEKLPQSKEGLERLQKRLNEEIDKAIEDGVNKFYFGACYGFDLMCANEILRRKKVINFKKPKFIKLIAVIPYEEQAIRWNEENRELYYNILGKCDDVITLNTKYKQGCYYKRNRYMVDRTSRLICYYNGGGGITGYIVNYAKKCDLQIVNLYAKKE